MQFLKETKTISRVLVVVWIFFSSAGAGFDTSQFVFTFPIMAIFFLLPAILIEHKMNPVWVKARNEVKIKSFEAEIVANQQRKEEAIRLQRLKEENERLKQEVDLKMAKATQDNSYDDCGSYNESDFDDISSISWMDGHEFEYFCADLFRKNGYSEVCVTPGSGDQGVDILAVKDGIKYAIQCKNYASPLGNTSVQEVNAGKTFYQCHVGVVLTNSTFTTGAIKLADATGVLLWDKVTLQKMIDAAQQ